MNMLWRFAACRKKERLKKTFVLLVQNAAIFLSLCFYHKPHEIGLVERSVYDPPQVLVINVKGCLYGFGPTEPVQVK